DVVRQRRARIAARRLERLLMQRERAADLVETERTVDFPFDVGRKRRTQGAEQRRQRRDGRDRVQPHEAPPSITDVIWLFWLRRTAAGVYPLWPRMRPSRTRRRCPRRPQFGQLSGNCGNRVSGLARF